MAKEKTPFHQVLVDNGLTADVLKAVLAAHAAELKKVDDAKAAEIAKLNADHATALKSATDSDSDVIAELKKKVDELSSKIEKTERTTPGTYCSKDKRTYKFKDGILEFVFARSGSASAETFETKKALQDATLMEELISIGAGYIQEVEV